jgi:hypothetical protein
MSETNSTPPLEQAVEIGVEAAEAVLHPVPVVASTPTPPVVTPVVVTPAVALPAKVRFRWAYSYIAADGSHPKWPAGATVADAATIAALVARKAPIVTAT